MKPVFVLLLSFFLFLLGADRASSSITLAKDGKAKFVIVTGDKPIASEHYATEELKQYLGRVIGTSIPIVSEVSSPDQKVIYVGDTRRSREILGGKTLDSEEWLIQATDSEIVIAGGRPRGTLYGVYEFLERAIGCHWLSPEVEVIPHRPDLAFEPFSVQAKPDFFSRYVVTAWYRQLPTHEDNQSYILFSKRNKDNTLSADARYGYSELIGTPGFAHTFGYYISPKEFFAKHPEYFSMGKNGEREGKAADVNSSWQLCLSNREVRKIVTERLLGNITEDRVKADREGAPYPRIYYLDQNDNAPSALCYCSDCSALTEKEGSASGLLLDFINEVAAAIELKYPEVIIATMAYECTEVPPRTIRPRANVMIRYCDLFFTSDLFRPLIHPVNKKSADLVRAWGRLVKPERLAIWDYWKSFEVPNITTPYSTVHTMQKDLQFFLQNKAAMILAEHEAFLGKLGGMDFISFYDLKVWMGYKLMQRPDGDLEALLGIFFSGYYGPAAKPMREYFDYLENVVLNTDGERHGILNENGTGYNSIRSRRYLSLDFFRKCDEFLQMAEEACNGDRELLVRVTRERIPLDSALLYLWKELSGRLSENQTMPWERAEVLARYRKTWENFSTSMYSLEFQKVVQDYLSTEFQETALYPLPEELAHISEGDIVDITWQKFQAGRPVVTDDPDAIGGKALMLAGDPDQHLMPFRYGFYQNKTGETRNITLGAQEIPQDEKYHLYKIEGVPVDQCTVWVHWTNYMQQKLDVAFDPNDPRRRWDCYLSIKLVGDAYVPNSTQESAIFLERVILVRTDRRE